MLKIMIKTEGNKSDTSMLGMSTIGETVASYQALLVLAENIKQGVIKTLIESKDVNYEEAESDFNRLVEIVETVVKEENYG